MSAGTYLCIRNQRKPPLFTISANSLPGRRIMRNVAVFVFFIVLCSLAGIGQSAEQPESPKSAMVEKNLGAKARIGVYDSRAIAVVSIGGKAFRERLQHMQADYEKAKAEGDQKRMDALKAEGAAGQKRLHMQGFSTAPVDDILENIKDRLPEIERKAGVQKLVSKWDKKTLAKYKSAELVDVTLLLVDAFQPNESQRKIAVEIQKHEPISLEQAEKIKD
jgi:hypothetical protein